ncbi:type II toxin-antitoxin system MqsA family antitoxin [Pseudomonas viridiflava]|uniref:type II toxin-antitoxin system MqsA family antitoxin n=1 Tax=Pseudomonas syringae group TaxID=136849 RepID=UPI0009B4CAA5|nr:type II toxin-antitoxin system MqsA family antitoxin [Pseudomonas cannabina]MEE4156360.1 type II toxin-antitoxin system MqsA family antitoxin [Pseudomonas viridiflava]
MSSVEKCPCCGAKEEWTKFSEETQEFGPTSSHFSVDDLSGERCLKCGEELFSPESNKKIVTAINDANRKKNADFVKNVRKNKIGITQGEAVKYLSGGGHNAFSRYENAEVSIPKPLLILMHVLDKEPHLYEEIKKMRVRA